MYSLVPEKTLRLVYEPFYLAISIVEFVIYYEIISIKPAIKHMNTNLISVIPAKAGIQ